MGKEAELLQAAKSGDTTTIEGLLEGSRTSKLLRRGPSVNCTDASGLTALHFAALHGHYEACQVLIKFDANANARDENGCYPLHLAVWGGHTRIAQLFLTGRSATSRASVNAQDKHLDTPLHIAAQHGHAEVVALLLKFGADPTKANAAGESPLDLAARYGRVAAVEALLLHSSKLLDVESKKHTPLHLAARNGHVDVVQMLLDHGMNINAKTEIGTALHEAALYGKAKVVELLLQRGINASAHNSLDQTALQTLDRIPPTKARNIRAMLAAHLEGRNHRTGEAVPKARAIMDYSPSVYDTDALSFRRGDVFVVLERPDSGWWRGRIDQKTGLFPHTYVELITEEDEEPDMAAEEVKAETGATFIHSASGPAPDEDKGRGVSSAPADNDREEQDAAAIFHANFDDIPESDDSAPAVSAVAESVSNAGQWRFSAQASSRDSFLAISKSNPFAMGFGDSAAPESSTDDFVQLAANVFQKDMENNSPEAAEDDQPTSDVAASSEAETHDNDARATSAVPSQDDTPQQGNIPITDQDVEGPQAVHVSSDTGDDKPVAEDDSSSQLPGDVNAAGQDSDGRESITDAPPASEQQSAHNVGGTPSESADASKSAENDKAASTHAREADESKSSPPSDQPPAQEAAEDASTAQDSEEEKLQQHFAAYYLGTKPMSSFTGKESVLKTLKRVLNRSKLSRKPIHVRVDADEVAFLDRTSLMVLYHQPMPSVSCPCLYSLSTGCSLGFAAKADQPDGSTKHFCHLLLLDSVEDAETLLSTIESHLAPSADKAPAKVGSHQQQEQAQVASVEQTEEQSANSDFTPPTIEADEHAVADQEGTDHAAVVAREDIVNAEQPPMARETADTAADSQPASELAAEADAESATGPVLAEPTSEEEASSPTTFKSEAAGAPQTSVSSTIVVDESEGQPDPHPAMNAGQGPATADDLEEQATSVGAAIDLVVAEPTSVKDTARHPDAAAHAQQRPASHRARTISPEAEKLLARAAELKAQLLREEEAESRSSEASNNETAASGNTVSSGTGSSTAMSADAVENEASTELDPAAGRTDASSQQGADTPPAESNAPSAASTVATSEVATDEASKKPSDPDADVPQPPHVNEKGATAEISTLINRAATVPVNETPEERAERERRLKELEELEKRGEFVPEEEKLRSKVNVSESRQRAEQMVFSFSFGGP